jgi:hypothetical protein
MARQQTFWKGAPAVVVALTLVACAAGPGSASPRATASSDSPPGAPAGTPSAKCINPPVDLLTLINQTNPVACYGDTEITVEAEPIGIGAIDCAALEPAWFRCWSWVALQPIVVGKGTSGFVLAATTGPPALPSMFATIHPETALSSVDIIGERLRVTGHFDDPAAQTCVETEAPFGGPSTPPDEVIAMCQRLFVLTGFERL